MQIKEKTRTSGKPASMNESSSFHLIWDMPEARFNEVSAILRIESAPTVDAKYFWALQMGFYNDDRELVSGAHAGLMYYGLDEGKPVRAVNWGGYNLQAQNTKLNENKDETEAEDWISAELQGTTADLPLCPDKKGNTYLFDWEEGVDYKLRVHPVPQAQGMWRAEAVNLETGIVTVIRDLKAGGEFMDRFVVWSEVSAKCDDPSTSIVWSGFEAITESGKLVVPKSVKVNYATYEQGGCTNTNSESVKNGIRQRTNTRRITPQGAVLPIS